MGAAADQALRRALVTHDVDTWTFDATDFRRRARLLQAVWRVERGHPVGLHKGQHLGSRVPLPDAKTHGWNFLTPGIHQLARDYVEGPRRVPGALMKAERMYGDLLSSQPMCFNLFAELALDLDKATAFARAAWPGRVEQVEAVTFEHSPGRRDPRYLNNGTAFDVMLVHTVPRGGRGFIGIETKYHENMQDRVPAQFKPRYADVAAASGTLTTLDRARLWRVGTWQVWLDHMLAASMLVADPDQWRCGLSVLAYPAGNTKVRDAGNTYAALLRQDALAGNGLPRTAQWEMRTLEQLVDVMDATLKAPWVVAFRERYLAFEKLAAVCAGTPMHGA